ncbi:MAG: DUF885 domain-containing protein [Acidobacteriota bacterium]
MWRRRQAHPPDPSVLAAIEREALELLWRHNPVQASVLGIERYETELNRTDPGSRAEFCWGASECLARLEHLPLAADATPVERAERWALESLLRVPLVLEQEFSPFTRNPALYLELLLEGTYIMSLRAQGSPQRKRYLRAVLSRLEQVPRLLQEARRNLRPYATRVPTAWVEAALHLEKGGQAFFGQLDQCLRGEPALAGNIDRITTAARQQLSDYATFLRQEILPRARGTFSVGPELFHFLLLHNHYLPYRDVDLLEWGTHEIHESRKALERAAREIHPDRSWREILDELNEEHPPIEDLVSSYRQEVGRSRRFIEERSLATIPPRETLRVAETPEFERSIVPFAAYLPPPPFGDCRQGNFWVTPPGLHLSEQDRRAALRDHCRFRIPITALHEGYPGHHLQFSRLQDLDSTVRRHFTTPVFVEGWALYCEEMMIEQEFLSDPRSRLCQIRDHLWRACRVVLDVLLHTRSLELPEAARMLVEEACLQPPSAAAEVARYSQTPTQPLSYLIGKREIQALRREVERAQGSRFRLGEFHDQLLSYGPIPIYFLREILLHSRREIVHA